MHYCFNRKRQRYRYLHGEQHRKAVTTVTKQRGCDPGAAQTYSLAAAECQATSVGSSRG
jgi:hypothetical protein